nr:MAG TPA: DNA-directed RNA polymerase [Caudoviricetes sp.]
MLSGKFGCLECGYLYYKATTNDDWTFLECPRCGSYNTKELNQREEK